MNGKHTHTQAPKHTAKKHLRRIVADNARDLKAYLIKEFICGLPLGTLETLVSVSVVDFRDTEAFDAALEGADAVRRERLFEIAENEIIEYTMSTKF
jgi:hypothetical protein